MAGLPVFVDLVNSSVIYEGDHRFGWTSFYRYDPIDVTKTFRVITVALRARSIDEQRSLIEALGYSGFPGAAWQTGAAAYDNAAVRCNVNFTDVPGTPGRLSIDAGGPNPLQAGEAAAEGAVVIVRYHTDQAVVGSVYYLSQIDPVSNQWELDPRSDPLPSTNPNGVAVYLVGRGLQYPNDSWPTTTLAAGSPLANRRIGLSQVVSVQKMTSALP